MATNTPVRKRVVVKSKRPARSSDSSITDVPTNFADRFKQIDGRPPISAPERNSLRDSITADGEGVARIGMTSGERESESFDQIPLHMVLQHPRSSSLHSPRQPPPGRRKKEDTTSSSSDNERDEVFVSPPRQVFFMTPGNQLNSLSHYNQSFLEPAGQRKYSSKGRHNQVAPMTPSGVETSDRTPSPRHHSNHNTLLSSGSPHDEFSTVSSFSTSSPLPVLLTANMRRGGAPYHDSTTLLESILPSRVLKVFVGTWNMCGQKVNMVDKCRINLPLDMVHS